MNQIFSGKVVILYIKNPAAEFANGIIMQHPRIVEVHNRTFVVGAVPHSEGDWASGLRVGVRFRSD